MGKLQDSLPAVTFGVVSAYGKLGIDTLVAGVVLHDDDSLTLRFPKGHVFFPGTAITVHLDNRTGAEQYDANLQVYRCSYKGLVTAADLDWVQVQPIQFQVFYSFQIVSQFAAPGYQFPEDTRPRQELPTTLLRSTKLPNEKERDNKLGVLVTKAVDRPHTTVMAFLSSVDDDIFLVSSPETFKAQNLHRDPECVFAIDHRAAFLFERVIDWNFTILSAKAYAVPRETALFSEVQSQFVEKNPWEIAFFTMPTVEMYHLKPERILMADTLKA